jgi:hypothetical protein
MATLLMHPRFLDRSLSGLLHHLFTESQSVGPWYSVLAHFNSLTLRYKLASTDSLYVCGYLSCSLTSLTFTGSTNGGSAPDQYVKSMVKDRRIWLFNAYVPTSCQKLAPYWWSSIAAVLPSVLTQKLITCIRIEVEAHDEIHTEKPYTASTR